MIQTSYLAVLNIDYYSQDAIHLYVYVGPSETKALRPLSKRGSQGPSIHIVPP
jgi:hypothetical protein